MGKNSRPKISPFQRGGAGAQVGKNSRREISPWGEGGAGTQVGKNSRGRTTYPAGTIPENAITPLVCRVSGRASRKAVVAQHLANPVVSSIVLGGFPQKCARSQKRVIFVRRSDPSRRICCGTPLGLMHFMRIPSFSPPPMLDLRDPDVARRNREIFDNLQAK